MAGVFNGISDKPLVPRNADFDNEKDFAARVVCLAVQKRRRLPAARTLTSVRFRHVGSLEGEPPGRTAGYKTDGQQSFSSYAAATVADLWPELARVAAV